MRTGRIGLLRGTSAALLAAALATGMSAAQADDGQNGAGGATSTIDFPGGTTVTVTIPTIEATGANVDDATLRAIFSGDIAKHPDALAKLTADSIRIPTVTEHFVTPSTSGGEPEEGTLTLQNIDIENVKDGVAASAAIDGAVVNSGPTIVKLGKISASSVDMGAASGLYGLVPPTDDATTPVAIYKDFRIESGTISAPDASCSIGAISVAEFKARPLKSSLADIMALSSQMSDTEKPTPEAIAKYVDFLVDLTSAFEVSPVSFGGLNCSGTDDEKKPMSFAMADAQLGAYSGGVYPELTVNGITVTDSDGTMSVDKFTMKPIDYSGTLEALQAAKGAIDDDWVTAHGRALVPAFGGFSIAGVRMDMAKDPSSRVKASVGSFDLSLAGYNNGIPTTIASSAKDVVIDLAAMGADDDTKQLLAMGLTQLDLGYDFAASWDQASSTIKLDKFSVNGGNLGSLAVAAVIGNATEALFANDLDAATEAGMGLTVKQVSVDVEDQGAGDLVFKQVAQDQSTTPDKVRTMVAGMATGMTLAVLGQSPDAQKLATAIGTFLAGGKSLSATFTATAPEGLGMADFAALQSDPTVLSGKVSVEASAQ
jgi:hypothetical protein